jgi:PAS domain S-box-containing protein
MDETRNASDLILENERLRIEVLNLTQTKNDLLIYKQQLDAIFDSSPVEINLKDKDGRYIRVNKHFEKLFRFKNEDLIGLLTADIVDPELAASIRDHDLSVLNSGVAEWREEIVKWCRLCSGGRHWQARTV